MRSFGDAHNVFDILLCLTLFSFSRDAGTAHGVHRVADRVEEQADIPHQRGGPAAPDLPRKKLLHQAVGLGDRHFRRDHVCQRQVPLLLIFQTEQGTGVPLRKSRFGNPGPLLAAQTEQAQLVGHGGLRTAQPVRCFLLG